MSEAAELSIIILSWKTPDLLRACLRSVLQRDHGLRLQVIVVDNASEDHSADLVEQEFCEAHLVRNATNEGYAGGNNRGMALATAPLILLLNSDTEIQGPALRQLVDYMNDNPSCGAAAPRLVHADGRVQTSCMRFPSLRVGFLYDSFWERWRGRPASVSHYLMEEFDHLTSCDVDQPPGACFLWRRQIYESIGGFDEALFLFFNDVDLCRRVAAAGWKIHYLAEAEVIHHEGRSTSKFRDFVREWNVNRARYYKKHHGLRGSVVIKLAVILRAAEEAGKILWRGPRGTRSPALKEIRRVLWATLRV